MIIRLFSDKDLIYSLEIEVGIIGIIDMEIYRELRDKSMRFCFCFYTPEKTLAEMTYYTPNGSTLDDLNEVAKVCVQTEKINFVDHGFYKRQKDVIEILGFVSEA